MEDRYVAVVERLGADVTTDTVWGPTDAPVVVNDPTSVRQGANLTITDATVVFNEGITVRAGASLTVNPGSILKLIRSLHTP